MWIQTYTGKAFYPLDPKIEDVDILDIAHALSNICRFTGHVNRYYSVAEHCVCVSDSVSSELALQGLLHDASEAYLTDVARPIKPHLTNYQTYEDNLLRVIFSKFNLEFPIHPEVKETDLRILLNERNELMKEPPMSWNLDVEPLPDVRIYGFSPKVAENLFLNRFYGLYK